MAQDWGVPVVQQDPDTWYGTTLPAILACLKTDFAGSAEPTTGVEAFSTWLDTANLLLKRRNSANTAWTVEARVGTPPSAELHAELGDGSATRTKRFAAMQGGLVRAVAIVATGASSGSSGSDHYALQLTNVTQARAYFVTAPTTEGSEVLGDGGAWIKAADESDLTVNAGDVLELTWTLVGAGAGLDAEQLAAQISIEAG